MESIDSLVPFLQDSPFRACGVLEKIFIPVPYGNQYDEDMEQIPRSVNVQEGTFAKACTYLTAHPKLLPNLRQLDLRIRDYNIESFTVSVRLGLDNVSFSRKRPWQLASVADPHVMTLSF